MENIEKSDTMICNSISYNMYNWKKNNDLMFIKQMSNPQKLNLIDTSKEDYLKRGNSRECVFTPEISSRGTNNIETVYSKEPCYKLDEYLMAPCQTNTWQNWMVEDNNKKCSKHHQFYMNLTKR